MIVRMLAKLAFVVVTVAIGTALPLENARSQSAGGAFTPEQRKAVEEIVREYLRENPDVLMDAISAFREKQEAEAKRQTAEAFEAKRNELLNDPATPVAGNPQGDVTVVEFFDYRCGYCKRVFPVVNDLLKSDPKIRYVLKELPILGPESVGATRAALAAWRMDKSKYVPFRTALMETKGSLPTSKILQIAGSVGLDVPKLEKAMADPAIETMIDKNRALAQALGIEGTPAFIIGNELVPGAIDLDTFRRLVAAARKG
ncbi:MAG: DsbA family protein [Rhodospirillales bacterium]|nr:DsbA family protein [Rhodospirillales bacterium]